VYNNTSRLARDYLRYTLLHRYDDDDDDDGCVNQIDSSLFSVAAAVIGLLLLLLGTHTRCRSLPPLS
jgi:hypothetical protein